jgi:hypothetical protein
MEVAIVGLSRAAGTGLLTMTLLVPIALVVAWAWTLRRGSR